MLKEEHTFFGIGSTSSLLTEAKSLPATEREERIRDSQGRWDVSADGGGGGRGWSQVKQQQLLYNFCILYALTSTIVFFS
jgi:hypothetical protein